MRSSFSSKTSNPKGWHWHHLIWELLWHKENFLGYLFNSRQVSLYLQMLFWWKIKTHKGVIFLYNLKHIKINIRASVDFYARYQKIQATVFFNFKLNFSFSNNLNIALKFANLLFDTNSPNQNIANSFISVQNNLN